MKRLAELVVVELVGDVGAPCSVKDVTAFPPEVITTTTSCVVVCLGVVLGTVVEVENVVGVVDVLVVLEVVVDDEDETLVKIDEVMLAVKELDDVVEVELVVLVVVVEEVEVVDEVEVVELLVVVMTLVNELESGELVELAELSPNNKLLNLGSPLDNETVTITVTSPSIPDQSFHPARTLTSPRLRRLCRHQSPKTYQPEYASHVSPPSLFVLEV